MKILGVTGHRPERLGGYRAMPLLQLFAKTELERSKPDKVITGMALGWDQAIAEACIQLDIPFHAAIPFNGQEYRWPEKAQDWYRYLKSRASGITVVSSSYYNGVLLDRNIAIIQASSEMLALWDGEFGGGTHHAVKHTIRQKKPLDNAWERWEKYRESGC